MPTASLIRVYLRLSAVALLGFTSACVVGPNYQRPATEAPARYRFEDAAAQDTANTAWWGLFQDEQLNRLVEIALAENKNVLIAAARVEEFYGRYGVQRGQQFPQVALAAEAGSQRVSRVSTPPLPAPAEVTSDFYTVNLGISFELDLWGRLRRATEAARADLLAVEESRRTVILSLVSAVATAYVNLLNLDRQLDISQRTVATRAESVRIFDLRFKGGVVSEMELQQVRSEYETALATVPALEKQIGQQENDLSVVLGRNPGAIVRGRTLETLALPAIPAGLPSELLERRPDIRQAEQQLIAANARIGVAKAAFYPSISLTGVLGTASAGLSNLFSGAARTWSYAAALNQPIFTGGTLMSQLLVSEAQQRQALYSYQQAIQTAFGDVDNSLLDQAKTREQVAAQRRQVDALVRYAQLARARYEGGYTSYIEVLDAERSLFQAQLQLAQAQAQLYFALINLYKALGGGWVEEAERLAPKPAMDTRKEPPLFP
ncbi:MAG TPA: efflux transporter outer membrane subunit [Burkholderiales bacterium]|nr:efflux transporter outer membrane subunit [Burkholderiales bacterium]